MGKQVIYAGFLSGSIIRGKGISEPADLEMLRRYAREAMAEIRQDFPDATIDIQYAIAEHGAKPAKFRTRIVEYSGDEGNDEIELPGQDVSKIEDALERVRQNGKWPTK